MFFSWVQTDIFVRALYYHLPHRVYLAAKPRRTGYASRGPNRCNQTMNRVCLNGSGRSTWLIHTEIMPVLNSGLKEMNPGHGPL